MKTQGRCNHMEYWPDMEVSSHEMMDDVVNAARDYDKDAYTAEDVEYAIAADRLSREDFAALLSPAAAPYLEQMAQRAQVETMKHFGKNIYVFTPIYIANYCENHCVYCGFNCTNKIKRAKLNFEEIERELQAIAKTGLEEILILTGESHKNSSLEYIGEAVRIAKRYFRNVQLEIYPCNTEDYAFLHECGADFVTVFQETYNPDKYETLHLAGHKRIFPYRFHAQERALKGGVRGVAFAALLGLDDFRKDAFATGLHASLVQRKYPQAEISLSCPRLRPIVNDSTIHSKDVHERELLQILCAYRLFMPFANITVSTRERAAFRDQVIGLVATKVSAGVSTGIGEHADEEEMEDMGDSQFEIADTRSVEEVCEAITQRGLQVVMNDYVFV
ncbi:MAG: 2-iminoacetate synthase ThiH [Akkermansia sp.]